MAETRVVATNCACCGGGQCTYLTTFIHCYNGSVHTSYCTRWEWDAAAHLWRPGPSQSITDCESCHFDASTTLSYNPTANTFSVGGFTLYPRIGDATFSDSLAPNSCLGCSATFPYPAPYPDYYLRAPGVNRLDCQPALNAYMDIFLWICDPCTRSDNISGLAVATHGM